MSLSTLLGALGVKLTADDKEFDKKLTKAGEKIESFSKRAAIGLAGFTGAIALSVKALGEQEKAEARLEAAGGEASKALGINTQALKDQAAALQQVTTFGDEATIGAQAMLKSFLLTEDQIKGLTPGIQDLSALLGQDLKTSALQVGRAFANGLTVLKRSGVSYDEALEKTFKLGTQQEKTAILMQILADNAGGTARKIANTLPGAIDQATNAFGDLQEEFAKLARPLLIPAFKEIKRVSEELIEVLTGLTAEQKAWGTIAIASTGIGLALATSLGAVVAVLGFMPGLFAGMAIGLSAVGAIALGVVDTSELLGDTWTKVVKIMARAMNPLAGVVGGFMDLWDAGWRKLMVNLLTLFADTVENIINGVSGLATVFGPIGKELFGAITGDSVGGALRKAMGIDEAIAGLREVKDEASDAGKQQISIFERLVAKFKETAKAAIPTGPKGPGPTGRGITIDFDAMAVDYAAEVKKRLGEYIDALDAANQSETDARTKLNDELLRQAHGDKSIGGILDGISSAASDGGEALSRVIQNIGRGLADIGLEFVSELGKVGSLITAGIEGAAAGGPIGAIVAIILELLKSAEQFTGFIDDLNNAVEDSARMLNPLMTGFRQFNAILQEGVIPVTDAVVATMQALMDAGLMALFQALGMLLKAISPVFELIAKFLQPVMDVFGVALRGLAIVIGAVSVAVGWVVNAIIDVVKEVLFALAGFADIIGQGGGIRDFARSLDDNKADLDSLTRDLESIVTTGKARERVVDEAEDEALSEATKSVNEFTKSVQKATGEILNLPEVFKITNARAFATLGTEESFIPGGSASRVNVNAQQIVIVSQDPEDMAEQLADRSNWENQKRFGATNVAVNQIGGR